MLFGKNFIYEITQAFGVDENAPKIEVDEILKFTNEVNEVQFFSIMIKGANF